MKSCGGRRRLCGRRKVDTRVPRDSHLIRGTDSQSCIRVSPNRYPRFHSGVGGNGRQTELAPPAGRISAIADGTAGAGIRAARAGQGHRPCAAATLLRRNAAGRAARCPRGGRPVDSDPSRVRNGDACDGLDQPPDQLVEGAPRVQSRYRAFRAGRGLRGGRRLRRRICHRRRLGRGRRRGCRGGGEGIEPVECLVGLVRGPPRLHGRESAQQDGDHSERQRGETEQTPASGSASGSGLSGRLGSGQMCAHDPWPSLTRRTAA